MRFLYIFLFCLLSVIAKAEVNLKEITGRNIPFSSLTGKWVFINYWASWCKVCLAEIPELNSFASNNKNVALFGVNYDFIAPLSQKKLIKKLNIQYPVIEDPAFDLELGDIRGVPVTFVFNPHGELVTTLYGQQTSYKLQKIIENSNHS